MLPSYSRLWGRPLFFAWLGTRAQMKIHIPYLNTINHVLNIIFLKQIYLQNNLEVQIKVYNSWSPWNFVSECGTVETSSFWLLAPDVPPSFSIPGSILHPEGPTQLHVDTSACMATLYPHPLFGHP